MKTFFPELIGNDALRRILGTELAAGQLSHAYILSGVRGSGKHTLARQIAMAASCERRGEDGVPLPCGTCRTCRKIRDGLCPDIITVTRDEDAQTFGVDPIRDMRSTVAVVPNDLDVKFYILEDAHLLTTAAQNAFLLTLEEPPSFVCFLLLTEDADALLETVRSRAPVHRMRPIPRPILSHHLLKTPAGAALARENPPEFEELLLLSGGWPGEAEALLDAERRAPLLERRHFAKEAVDLLRAGSPHELLTAFTTRGNDRKTITADLNTLSEALRDLLLLSRSDAAPLIFYTDRDAATELSAHFTAAKLYALLSALEEAKAALAMNANVKITVTRLVSRLVTC